MKKLSNTSIKQFELTEVTILSNEAQKSVKGGSDGTESDIIVMDIIND